MANLRIQNQNDYRHVATSEKYKKRIRESSMFRKIILKGLGKKVGVVNIIAHCLIAPNKGYPIGFKDYKTYDKKRAN